MGTRKGESKSLTSASANTALAGRELQTGAIPAMSEPHRRSAAPSRALHKNTNGAEKRRMRPKFEVCVRENPHPSRPKCTGAQDGAPGKARRKQIPRPHAHRRHAKAKARASRQPARMRRWRDVSYRQDAGAREMGAPTKAKAKAGKGGETQAADAEA